MKKTLVVVLCLMLIVTSSVVAVAETISDVTITVATVNGPLVAGEEIAVPVTISEWANAYGGIKIEVLYDDSVLKLDCIEASSVDFGGALYSINDNEISLISTPNSQKQAEKVDGGEICIAYFIANEDVAVSTVVSVNSTVYGYTYGETDGWIAAHSLTTNVVSGGVFVEGTEPPTPDVPEPEKPEPTPLGDTTVTVATVKGDFSARDEIAIPVTVSEWANGYASMDMLINYDTSLLELVSIEPSETDFGGGMISTNGNRIGAIFNPATTEEAEKVNGGEIFVVYFVALTDIVESTIVTVDADISAYSYGEADNWVVEEIMNVTVVDGGIEYEESYQCEHIGGEATCITKAICDLCGEEYGELDADNHKDTVLQGGYDATCGADGKEDDTFCNDCQKVIYEGAVIPATGNHVGGEATCKDKAVCNVCGQSYGEIDAENHIGETEIRDANNKYTGDVYCVGCDQKLSEGQQYGDVNGDGLIAAEDALLVLQFSVDKIQLTGINLMCGDVDNNGIVDATDALLILQFSVDKFSEFPREYS